jgi:mRNA-degrading endonuclease RelE of RelBE toxin-antitoxin system
MTIIKVMETCERFKIHFAAQVKRHLQAIDRQYHSLIRKMIDEQLTFEPGVQTRNRKPVHPPSPFDAGWEIRSGPNNRFRVFYDINQEECEVDVLAIGEKEGNRLYIGGQAITSSEETEP